MRWKGDLEQWLVREKGNAQQRRICVGGCMDNKSIGLKVDKYACPNSSFYPHLYTINYQRQSVSSTLLSLFLLTKRGSKSNPG